MVAYKITANHKTEHIRIALAATADDAAQKAATLEAAGYWENVEVVEFVPVARKARRAA